MRFDRIGGAHAGELFDELFQQDRVRIRIPESGVRREFVVMAISDGEKLAGCPQLLRLRMVRANANAQQEDADCVRAIKRAIVIALLSLLVVA